MSDTDFQQSTTPPLEEVIRAGVREALLGVNVAMPAQVLSFDEATDSVSVQPVIQRMYDDAYEATPLPVINNVPVVFPRGGTFSMKWALAKDDYVTLVFSQRSLDIWKSQGGVVDPEDPRKFHLSDAIAIPGGFPLNAPIGQGGAAGAVIKSGGTVVTLADDHTTVVNGSNQMTLTSAQSTLENGGTKIVLTSGGKVQITNGTNELLAMLVELIGDIVAAGVLVSGTPGTLDPGTISALNNTKAKFTAMKV